MCNKCNQFKHGVFTEVALIKDPLSKQNTNNLSSLCVLGSKRKSKGIKIQMTEKKIRIVKPTLIAHIISNTKTNDQEDER